MIVTVDEVKAYLNLDDNTAETESLLTSFIKAHQKQIEKYINYELESNSKEIEFVVNKDSESYVFTETPINSVSSVHYKSNLFDAYKLVDSNDYVLGKDGSNTFLYLNGDFKDGYMYKISYSFGYTSAPDDLKQILIEMSARAFTESAVGGDLELGLVSRGINLEKYSQSIVFSQSLNTRWNEVLKRHRRY